MAQKMIDIKKKLENSRSIGIQTENSPDFYIQLSKNKFIEMYKSKHLDDYILSVNDDNRKKRIIITKSMWNILRKNFDQIDGTFMASRFTRI